MTSRSNIGEDLRLAPAPEVLARQLLATEFGDASSAAAFVAGGERAYLRLRERLTVLLGATGFDALWARAMYVARQQRRSENAPAVERQPAPARSGLTTAVHGYDALATQQYMIVVFTSFISLLFTFIGGQLGTRFIRQLWPDLPPDAAESRAEEATP